MSGTVEASGLPISARVFGSRSMSLEYRVFCVIALSSGCAGLVAMVLNLTNGNPLREVLLAALAVLLGFGSYGAVRTGRSVPLVSTLMVLFFSALLTVAWFFNDGSKGSAPLWMTMLVLSAVVVLPPRLRVPSLLGVVGLCVVLLAVEVSNEELMIEYISPQHRFRDIAAVLLTVLLVEAGMVLLVVSEHRKERDRAKVLLREAEGREAKLKDALAEIEELRGLLPICCACKKVRDDEGLWQEIETYISHRTAAEFTHSYCPECSQVVLTS